ncbi:MAG: hypothetical protein JWQ09_592 [Segetibacter sp.]|nr:hypothetical protein [Segetibacter sp.]
MQTPTFEAGILLLLQSSAMTFKASLDGLAKGVTIAVSFLFALVLTQQIYLYLSGAHLSAFFTALPILAIYFATFFFRPIYYDITEDKLVIHRTIKDVIIKRQDIKRVEPIHKDQMKWTIRTFGVGGLFGYYGFFVNSKLGDMTWYATRRDKTVLIETVDDKKFIVTPDEPEAFIKQLSEHS